MLYMNLKCNQFLLQPSIISKNTPPSLLYIYSTYQYSGILKKISDLSHFFNNTCNCVNPGKDLHNRWGTIFAKGMKVGQHEERKQSQKHNIGKLKV